VITIDPAPPIYSAGTVNLYTREFLELCKSRLTESGVVALWLPPAPASELMMIMKTFANVFPGASLWGGLRMPGFYLIGGHRSFEQTPDSLSSLARRLSKIPDLSEWDTFYQNEALLTNLYLLGPEALRGFVKNIPEVTDDHPYTEFPLWRGALTGKMPDFTAYAIRRQLQRLRKVDFPSAAKFLIPTSEALKNDRKSPTRYRSQDATDYRASGLLGIAARCYACHDHPVWGHRCPVGTG
jgi:spermidine synthase